MMSSLPPADVEVVEVDRKTKTAKKRRKFAMELDKHALHTTPASNSSGLSTKDPERSPPADSQQPSEQCDAADASGSVVSIQVES